MEDPKEKASKTPEMREELHNLMDKQLKDRAHRFKYYRECNDMDSYWNSCSIAVEKAWSQYLEPNGEFQEAAKGRGQCAFIRTKPKAKANNHEDELDTVRSKETYMAITQLKQSRGCRRNRALIFWRQNSKGTFASALFAFWAHINIDYAQSWCRAPFWAMLFPTKKQKGNQSNGNHTKKSKHPC